MIRRPHRDALPWPDDGRWHYRRSLASRVAVLTALAVGAAVGIMAVTTFVVMRMQLQSSLDSSLLERARAASQTSALSEVTLQGVPSWMLGAADVLVILVNSEFRVIHSADDIRDLELGQPELRVAQGRKDQSIRTIEATGGEKYRVAAVPAGANRALVLAQPLEPTVKTLSKLGTVLLVYFGLGVLAALLAGWLVAANGLRPVRRLTASVERIAVTEDLTPLRIEGDDEVARLGAAFNQMLLTIGASRQRQAQLVADASHELRTPLTSVRTNLDLLRHAEGDPGLPAAARIELLDDVRAQMEEMSTLIGDLVVLARDEQPVTTIETLDLAEIVERALSRVRRRAAGIAFEVDLAPWRVRCDASALERAVTNLLDNAAKWSPPEATITVNLAGGVLTVDDEGPGVAEADRAHVFDRFWRSSESRSMPGSGLGLAIVRQVVDRHGGQVAVTSAPTGGARFSLWLPAAD